MTRNALTRLDIVIPFYKDPQLVSAIAANLRELAAELKPLCGSIYWVNDYPKSKALTETLTREAESLREVLDVVVLTNRANHGFVKAANRGLRRAAKRRNHAMLLNSDALLTTGAVANMLALLDADPMLGFVNPRSNNATLSSFPSDLPASIRDDPKAALEAFNELNGCLQPYHYVPTCVGYCLLIRNTVLMEFGLLDVAYGRGYNEENDLILRANRYGFTAALCNRAYVFHEGAKSFGETERTHHESNNAKLLSTRYPEYSKSVGSWYNSAQFKYERLVSNCYLERRRTGKPTIAVDCLHVALAHNGTFRAAKEIIRAFASAAGGYNIVVLCDGTVARFHGFDSLSPHIRIVEPADIQFYDIYFKIGQPFSLQDIARPSEIALHVTHLMLDTIAWDCMYLRTDELAGIWDFAARFNDAVFFNSQFTQERFLHRFPRFASRPQAVCGHSLYYGDYLGQRSQKIKLPKLPRGPWKEHILLFGNHYKHKFLQHTVKHLARSRQDVYFWALGMETVKAPNVRAVPSGGLSDAAMEGLFTNAGAVVFPSLYEGFGFPITEALARNKLVFARSSALNWELLCAWEGPGTLMLYESTEDLVHMFANFDEIYRDHIAKSLSFQGISHSQSQHSWDAVVRRIIAVFDTFDTGPINSYQTLERLRHLEAMGVRHRVNGESWSKNAPQWMRALNTRTRKLRQTGSALVKSRNVRALLQRIIPRSLEG